MFSTMLINSGFNSGVVYASGIMKAHDVMRMAADFRAQETISAMTQRILIENGVPVNEEIATAGHDDYSEFNTYETNCDFSIPSMSSDGKGVMVNA
ncbi:hypothetical protein HQN90_17665 [Paenibacillus alba]|uniref:hypothetical protein n=1 Tax=Paenibacillus alba TaxID=1197127 RepID=UPI00156539D8|nr:hypothetical protein [Paenibacillus alba]NQX67952.1 hypothetical protein [Paenibacillus alba]